MWARIEWLKENGYRYLVASRERKRDFDERGAATVETASGRRILDIPGLPDNPGGTRKFTD